MRATSRGIFRHLASVLWLAFTLTGTLAAQPYAPTTGNINNLVVFIRFSDQPEFTRPLSYYDGLFNSASNSLKNFYLESSYNAVTVNSTFYPAAAGNVVSYQDSHPTDYYKPYDAATNPNGYRGIGAAGSTARQTALVTNALNAISAQIPAGLNLDGNGDGYIDHIVFEVYSSDLNPLPVLFYSRATYDSSGSIVINGKHVGNYTWVSAPQDREPSYPGATEIHEMGHSFGYPDLRDNSGRTPVGDWDVMSLSRPVHSGAYMKHRFTRWIADIPEIKSYGTYTINDLTQATNNAYKIAIPNSSEYLVLEYRKAAGPFESRLPDSGLCITRVNEAAGIWGNLDGPPYFLYYYRVDGSTTNDGGGNAWVACLNAESGRTQFNDRSNPACFRSDGGACGISIHGIGSTSGTSMTFSVGDPNAVTVTRVISGYLTNGGNRVSGATVTLSGDATSVATTGSAGTYAFSVPEHGDYTVTPAKTNLSFSPITKTFSNVTTDQVQNFSGANNTATISGTIRSAGLPLAGVVVYCNGGNYPAPVTTDATGSYSFTVHAGGDYQVWPSKTGYFFSPSSKTLTNVATNLAQDFNTISSSSTSLASSLNPSSSGQSVTFTASIIGYAPSGSVDFSDWGIAVCPAVAVSNGQARCTTSSLGGGDHSIAAAYSGDGSNYASHSAVLTQVVGAPTVTFTPSGELAFPAQTQGTTSTPQTVTLANTGTAPLTIGGISVAGDFAIAATNCGSSLAAGASCATSITFTPIASGTRGGLLSIADSAAGGPHTINLSGSGAAAPTIKVVAPGASATLTDATPVTAGGGSTLAIPNASAGALISLPAPAGGTEAQVPVEMVMDGRSLRIAARTADAVVRVNLIVVNGKSTPALQTVSGTQSVTAGGISQPMVVIGGTVVSSESMNATATSSVDPLTGDTRVTVVSGTLSLASAALADGKLFAGESALIDASGAVATVSLGSTNGSGSAGDPISVVDRPPGLDLGGVTIPNLKGTVARLDGGAQALEQAILAAAPGMSLGAGGQAASGALPVVSGTQTSYLQPLGSVSIDTTQPDGATIDDEGMIRLTKGGVVVRFAPSLPDTRRFATDLDAVAAGANTRLTANGAIVARLGGTSLVLQPGLVSAPGAAPGPAGFEQDGKGYIVYRDGSGSRQTLYPAFLELKTLNQALKASLGSGAVAVPDFAGSASVSIGGVATFTLTPDYALSGVPAAQNGQSWWAEPAGGKFFIVNQDGSAQGFTAK